MSDSMSDAEKDLRVFCDAVGAPAFARVYDDLHAELMANDPAQAAALELLATRLHLMRDVLEEWVPRDGGVDVQD